MEADVRTSWKVLFIGLLSPMALAQSPDQSTSATKLSIPATEFASHKTYFSSGFRTSLFGSGLMFGYQRLITPRLAIGGSLSGTTGTVDSEGGDLDNGQFYKDKLETKTTTLDLLGTFYFRENGYAKWGFFLRGGVGHAWNRAVAGWGRYDRDPGFFIIGDEKRLRESGEVKAEWDSTYARLGAYYQFLWGFNSYNRLGHVLELGVSGVANDKEKTLSYVKPNGNEYKKDTGSFGPLVEITYSLAF
jgi:hypothetical protein